MKTSMKKLIAMIMCAVLCVSVLVAFPACGTPAGNVNYSELVVYSNGGTSVVMGNEVYYINGIADYTDESGDTNITGSVVKGGLYKTTVTDYRDTLENTEAALGGKDPDADGLYDVMDFKNISKLDYKQLGYYTIGSDTEPARVTDSEGNSVQNFVPTNGGKSEYRVQSEQVISKKIGTSGYADGGFWIFDGIVYFATPDTDRDTSGAVLYNRVEFYSYDLTTETLNHLRTATEVNASTPYAFYKKGDSVYLVTFESYYANSDDEADNVKTGFIISTKITNGKVGETKEIASDVKSAYFPRVETYDPKNNPANTLEHYIYFTTTETESAKDASVLAMISPDGNLPADESGKTEPGYVKILTNTIGDITIEGTTADYLYYRNPSSNGQTALECTNLETQLKSYDSTAKTFTMPAGSKILVQNVSDYTAFLPIEQDNPDNAGEGAVKYPCVMGTTSSGIFRIDPAAGITTRVFDGEASMAGYNYGRVYFTYTGPTGEEDEDGESVDATLLASCSAFEDSSHQTVQIVGLAEPDTTFDIDFISISYKTDFANSKEYVATETYAMYYSSYSTTETKYAYLSKVGGIYTGGSTSIRLGVVADFDRPVIVCHDDQCLNWTHDHSSWEDLTTDEEETA